MSIPEWPALLPAYILTEGFSISFRNGRAKTARDVGPQSMRRRSTSATKPMTGAFECNYAQVRILEAFWDTELKGGVLPFLMPQRLADGRALTTDDGTPLTTDLDELLLASDWWLANFAEPPQITNLGADWYRVSFSVDILS